MAKNKAPQKQQFKAEDPKQVDALTQQFQALSENDKGMMLRKSGITCLQSRWRPLRPTPEIQTVINKVGRLTTLMRLTMDLMGSRRLPVEDLSVISEDKLRKEAVEPINELLDKAIHDIEEVLNKNKERANNKGKTKKQTKPVEPAEPAEEAEGAPEAEGELKVAQA